jgi:hypothetical protein
MTKAYSPNGDEIIGTLELIFGVAKINGATKDEHDGIQIDYAGDTEILWDSQQTEEINGERIYVCEAGKEWKESEIELR